MFAVYTAASSAWLTALLVVWAALLLGGVAASFLSRQRMVTWLRLGSSLTLVRGGVELVSGRALHTRRLRNSHC